MNEEFMKNRAATDAEKLVEAFYADEARALPQGMPAIEGKKAISRAGPANTQ